MFPFEIDDDVEVLEQEEKEYAEYEINYETGQLTGRIVTGAEAIKVWIYLALHTDRYTYEQYSWDYGCEISSLIGQSLDQEYIKMEARRLVEDCLLQHPKIEAVTEFDCTIEKETLKLSFSVETEFGEVEVDV